MIYKRAVIVVLGLFIFSLLLAQTRQSKYYFYRNFAVGTENIDRASAHYRESPTDPSAALKRMQPKRPYIVIDRYTNTLYLRNDDSVLLETNCSTGSGMILHDSTGNRRWQFDTPAGVFSVDSKLIDPWWRKPDWAYIEEDKPLPKNERDRYDSEMMGSYAIGFGDGYFIHGTIYERLLGISVTHGCVRVNAHDLRTLFESIDYGTPVYIY